MCNWDIFFQKSVSYPAGSDAAKAFKQVGQRIVQNQGTVATSERDVFIQQERIRDTKRVGIFSVSIVPYSFTCCLKSLISALIW